MNSKISVSENELQVPPRRSDVEVKIYEANDLLVSVVVPSDYARALESVRELRTEISESDEGSEERAELSKTLESHSLGSRALPEDVLEALEYVPRKSTISRVYLAEQENIDSHFEPGLNADCTSEHRELGLVNATAADVRRMLQHGWAHVAAIDCEKERRMFSLAAQLEEDGYSYRDLASTSETENWCVHLGEVFLGDNDGPFNEFVVEAPFRSIALATALKRMVESSVGRDRSTSEDLFLRRVAQVEANKKAAAGLQKLLSGAESEVISDAATRLLFYTDAEASASMLKNLTRLELADEFLADQELAVLKELKDLEHLDLSGTAMGRKSLALLKNNNKLRWLSVARTDCFDLNPLKELKELEYLDLADTPIRDDNLIALNGLAKLKDVDLRGTDVTNSGVKSLQSYLPECKVQI